MTVGRFDLVAQLASELKERRLARTRPPEHESLRIRQRDGGGSTAPQQDHLSPPRDEPREEDQNHALVPRKVATPGRQRSNDELLTQEGVLGNEFLARAGCVETRSNDHRGRARRNAHCGGDLGDHLDRSGTEACDGFRRRPRSLSGRRRGQSFGEGVCRVLCEGARARWLGAGPTVAIEACATALGETADRPAQATHRRRTRTDFDAQAPTRGVLTLIYQLFEARMTEWSASC